MYRKKENYDQVPLPQILNNKISNKILISVIPPLTRAIDEKCTKGICTHRYIKKNISHNYF